MTLIKNKIFTFLFLFISTLFIGNTINAAVPTLLDQKNKKENRSNDPCFKQKLIWSGYKKPGFLKKIDYKNIFVVNEKTVKDELNGLEWKLCPEGQQFINNKCIGDTALYTWYEAPSKVKGRNFAGKNDWRVPTIDELETIVDFCATNGFYSNEKTFPKTDSGIYWSISDDPGFYNEFVGWYLDFSTTVSSFLDKKRLGRVRAVRTMK